MLRRLVPGTFIGVRARHLDYLNLDLARSMNIAVETEPYVPDRLSPLDNIILTPHFACRTKETLERMNANLLERCMDTSA